MRKIRRIAQKVLMLFVIVNLITPSFYPVLLYAQNGEDQNASYLTDDFGTAAPEDPLLSQTPGMTEENDINKDFEQLQPVVVDEETQEKTLEAYDELAQKMADITNVSNIAVRVEEEKKAPERSYTLANEILERGGSVREVNLADQAGRLWNGFTSAISGIGAAIKNAVAPDEETRRAQQAAEEAKKEFEAEFGGERIQRAERRLADLAAALASVNAEEKAKIVKALGLGTNAADADLYFKFNGDKGLQIQGDPVSGSFVITTQYGGSVRVLYESPGYAGWSRKEAVQRIEKTGEIIRDLGTLGLYSAVQKFPELVGEVLPKVKEACSSTVDTNSNGFRILVGEYQGGSEICADPTTCVPQVSDVEKEEAKAAAAQIKAGQGCYDAFSDYTELMADAYAGITGAVLNVVIDPIIIGGVVIKVTSQGASAAMRLAGKSVRVSEGTRVIRPSEIIPAPIPEGRAPVAGVKPQEIRDVPFTVGEKGTSGVGTVRRFEPSDVTDSIAPSAGERAAEAVRGVGQVPGKTAAELYQEEIERAIQDGVRPVAQIETGRVAREAAERAVALAETEAAEKAAEEAARQAVGEAIARVGGRELVPVGPVPRAVAWVEDTFGGLFGRRAGQEAAGLTRGEAAKAIDEAADDAVRLVRGGRPVEEAVAEAVDTNLGKALGEIVDGEAKDAGEKSAQAIAAQGAAGKTYFKDRRRTGAGTVEITENDELVTTWQFESLEKLYAAAPENVAKPIRIIKEGDKVVGYEMEFVEGMSAREFIEKNGSLPEELRQKIRAAVDNLHQKGVAHGDLNPGNIMITPDGQVKFIDPFPYPDFRPEYAQRDIDRLAGWLNSDRASLPREEIPQAIAATRVAREETEQAVAEVGGRLVGIPEIPRVAPSNPVTRVVQLVTNPARRAYDSTIGRVFERKGKEIGREAGEQVALDARKAAEEAIPPVEAPRPVIVSPEAREITTGVEDFIDNTLGRLTGRGEPEQAARIQPTREPIAQRTVAKLRGVNEDAVLANHSEGFIAVFDGAGGHESGSVASGIAKSVYESVLGELPERPSTREVLIALRTAHDRAIESMGRFARLDPVSGEMGTTATVVKVFEEGGERRAAILSVGDTRAYEVTKNGRVHQLTQDEGLLANDVANGKITSQRAQEIQRRLDEVTDVSQLSREEAYYFEKKNIVSNLLTPGVPSVPGIDVFRLGENADYIFIASDGVHDNLTASQIEEIARSGRNPQEVADDLVNAARKNAGRQLNHRAKDDDMTVVAIDVSNRGRGNPQGIITNPRQALEHPDRPVYVGAAQEQTRFGGIKTEVDLPSVANKEVYLGASENARKFITDPSSDEITAIAMAIERELSKGEISNAYKRAREIIDRLKAQAKVTSYEIHEAEVIRHPNGNVEEIIRPTGRKGERLEFNYNSFFHDPEVLGLLDDLTFETGTDAGLVVKILDLIDKKFRFKQSEAGVAASLEELHKDIESSLREPLFIAALARESTLKEAPPLIEQSKRAFEVLRDFCLNNGVSTTLLSNCMRYFPDKIFEISNIHIVSPEALQKLCRRGGDIAGCFKTSLGKIMVLMGRGKQVFVHECTHKYCALVATNTSDELGDLLRSRRKDIKPAAGQAAIDSLYYYLTQNENKLIEGLTEYATQKATRLLGEKAPYVAYPEAVNLIEKRVIPTIMKNSNRTREQAEAIVIEGAFGNYEKLFLEIGAGSKDRGIEILTSILDEWIPRTPGELRGLQRLLTAMKVAAIGTVGAGGGVEVDKATKSLLDNYLNKSASPEPEENSSLNPPKLLPFSGIKKVLAAGETTGQTGYFIDSNALEFAAKKEMVKNSLSEGQGVTSEDLGQILKTDVIGSETFRVQGGYMVTTGKSGAGEGFIDLGKYIVEVGAIPGVDIKILGVVEVKAGQETVIPVAIKKGSGKVEKKRFVQSTGTEKDKETSKVTVVVFADKNNNGKLDKNEDILPWAGLTVELKRVTNDSMISLHEGDNQFTLPILPDKLLTASILLREIALQDGDAVSVSTLENGAWKTYVAEGAKAYSFEDFPILPEKSYSIKSRRDSTFLLKGQELAVPVL